MQDLGADMEDLLRKAAENYPLKQTEDAWDEIASKLGGGPISSTPVPNRPAKIKRYVGAFLILILLLFSVHVVSKLGEPIKREQQNVVVEKAGLPKTEAKPAGQPEGNTINNGKTTHTPGGSNKDTLDDPTARLALQDSKLHSPGSEYNSMKNSYTGKDFEEESNPNYEIAPLMRLTISSAASSNISMESNTHKSLLKHPIYVPTAVSQLAAPIEIQKEKKESKKLPVQKLYFGLLAGPGFNTVEKQKLTKAGLNIGVLAGYQVNRAFSIETGIIWSEKFYSTSGAHFNMKIIGPAMPAGMNVMEIDGCTQVLEIPVNLRYSFMQRNKRSLYSIAGFSSYIVDKESNHYHASMNGAAEMMYGTYKSNKGYFASSINLGIGYEQKLGKKTNVRVQPYVQLPVTGIGVGDLHVMSTGLYIGITRIAH